MTTNVSVRSLTRGTPPVQINKVRLSSTVDTTVDLDVAQVRRDLHRFLGQWVVTDAGEPAVTGGIAQQNPTTVPAETGGTATYLALAAAPAGGTGATAGGFATSAERDAAITLVNNIKTDYNKTIEDVQDLYAAVVELQAAVETIVDALQATGLFT